MPSCEKATVRFGADFALKGYLRAGKILQLMEKREKALDMYSYGLRHTAPTDADLPVPEDRILPRGKLG